MTTTEVPSKIQVGPLNFKVKFVDNVGEKLSKANGLKDEEAAPSTSMTYGCMSIPDLTIYLAKDQKPDITADTLLHEVLHAIWGVVGGWAYPEADEERIVSMLTGTLLDTLRRNKELVGYLFNDD